MGWLIECAYSSCGRTTWAANIVDLIANHRDANGWFLCPCGQHGYVKKTPRKVGTAPPVGKLGQSRLRDVDSNRGRYRSRVGPGPAVAPIIERSVIALTLRSCGRKEKKLCLGRREGHRRDDNRPSEPIADSSARCSASPASQPEWRSRRQSRRLRGGPGEQVAGHAGPRATGQRVTKHPVARRPGASREDFRGAPCVKSVNSYACPTPARLARPVQLAHSQP